MRIGIDVGGTFTDFVLLEDATGRASTYKCLTTPRDPSDAIEQGDQEARVNEDVCHARSPGNAAGGNRSAARLP